MNMKTRIWVLMSVLLSGVLLLLGVMGGLLPQLTSAASTTQLAESTQQEIDVQLIQLGALQKAEESRGELESQLGELRSAIPPTVESERFLRELDALMQSSGAQVTELRLGAAEVPEAPTPAAGDETAEGDAAAADAAAQVPASPTTLPSGIIVIPLNLTLSGTPQSVANFVRDLQLGDRLVRVATIEMTDESETTRATLTGSLFVYPQS